MQKPQHVTTREINLILSFQIILQTKQWLSDPINRTHGDFVTWKEMSGSGAVIGSKNTQQELSLILGVQSELLMRILDTQKKEKSFVVVLTTMLS